jgi:hypothetical protein
MLRRTSQRQIARNTSHRNRQRLYLVGNEVGDSLRAFDHAPHDQRRTRPDDLLTPEKQPTERTTLIMPVSSSRFMKVTPEAVPGRLTVGDLAGGSDAAAILGLAELFCGQDAGSGELWADFFDGVFASGDAGGPEVGHDDFGVGHAGEHRWWSEEGIERRFIAVFGLLASHPPSLTPPARQAREPRPRPLRRALQRDVEDARESGTESTLARTDGAFTLPVEQGLKTTHSGGCPSRSEAAD